MKRITIVGLFAALMTLFFAGAASATGGEDNPSADNKKVTFCHYDGSNENGGSGKYSKITTSVNAFYNAGHIDHVNDIWAAFTYVTNGGDTVNVPAQGDTSLLAFDDCEQPKVDEQVAKPDVTFADPCGTANDVFAVPSGRGYLVGAIVQNQDGTQSITVTLDTGFDWLDGSRDGITFTRPGFTNVDCDIPNTGAPQYASGMGALALAGVAALGGVTLLRRRQNI